MGLFRYPVLGILLLQTIAFAQPGPPVAPAATVGVPYTFDFAQVLGLQNLPAAAPGVSFSYTFKLSSGSLPPGITLSAGGLLSGTPTTAGQYNFALTLSLSVSAMGYSQSIDIPLPGSIS